MSSFLLHSAPTYACLAHPGTSEDAISLLKQYGIEQVSCVEARKVAGYLRARFDMIDGYRYSNLDRLKRVFGIRKRWPLLGLVVTDTVVEEDEDLVAAISMARQTRIKVVFIGRVAGMRLMANLNTLKPIN